jgi:predicted TIM-barrel fold metal-dependent hydrolase
LIEWVGIDRLLFSSDHPHWDDVTHRHSRTCANPNAQLRIVES